MLGMSTIGLNSNSLNDEYLYTGYIIKPNDTEVTVIHIAVIKRATKRSLGVQTAVVFEKHGMIFGTIKDKKLDKDIPQEFWELFYGLIQRHTDAVTMIAEPPTALAHHYAKTYPNIALSDKNPAIALPGLSTIEITIER